MSQLRPECSCYLRRESLQGVVEQVAGKSKYEAITPNLGPNGEGGAPARSARCERTTRQAGRRQS